MTVLRETLAAIDNAEAPPLPPAPTDEGIFAGSAGGLGAGEAARLALTPEAVDAIIERELSERRAAAVTYTQLGRHEEAATLTSQAALLAGLT